MNRRAFFKRAGTMGVGLAGAALIGTAVNEPEERVSVTLPSEHRWEGETMVTVSDVRQFIARGSYSRQVDPAVMNQLEVLQSQVDEFNDSPRYFRGQRMQLSGPLGRSRDTQDAPYVSAQAGNYLVTAHGALYTFNDDGELITLRTGDTA